MQARKNGICRDTCFYGCATAFENFKTRCFLDGALASCPCEDYRPATSFSNRIRAFNPPPELLEEIMGVWDFYDPADLANLTYEQQDALLRILNILYDDYGDDTVEED